MARLGEEALSTTPFRVHRRGVEQAAQPDNKNSSEIRREVLAELLRRDSGNANLHPLSFTQQRLWFL